MDENKLSATTIGFGLSVVITSVLSTLLMIVKETHEETVMAWMKKATPHHWITHGIIVVILFVVLGFLLGKMNGGKGIEIKSNALAGLLVAAAAASFVAISGFYLLE